MAWPHWWAARSFRWSMTCNLIDPVRLGQFTAIHWHPLRKQSEVSPGPNSETQMSSQPALGGDARTHGCCTRPVTKRCHGAPPGTSSVIRGPAFSGGRGQRFQLLQSSSKSVLLGSFSHGFGLLGTVGTALCSTGLRTHLVLSNWALSHRAVGVPV